MTDPAPQDTPPVAPSPPLNTSQPVAAGSMERILTRVTDPEIRTMLESPRGGQLARSVAVELDLLYSMVARMGQDRPSALITDAEATALEQWLHRHFSLTGRPPQPGERLVNRVMMTLHGMYQQVQELQTALANRPTSSTPVK